MFPVAGFQHWTSCLLPSALWSLPYLVASSFCSSHWHRPSSHSHFLQSELSVSYGPEGTEELLFYPQSLPWSLLADLRIKGSWVSVSLNVKHYLLRVSSLWGTSECSAKTGAGSSHLGFSLWRVSFFHSMGNSLRLKQKQNGFFVLLKSEYKLSFYTHIWIGSQAAGAQGVALWGLCCAVCCRICKAKICMYCAALRALHSPVCQAEQCRQSTKSRQPLWTGKVAQWVRPTHTHTQHGGGEETCILLPEFKNVIKIIETKKDTLWKVLGKTWDTQGDCVSVQWEPLFLTCLNNTAFSSAESLSWTVVSTTLPSHS